MEKEKSYDELIFEQLCRLQIIEQLLNNAKLFPDELSYATQQQADALSKLSYYRKAMANGVPLDSQTLEEQSPRLQ